MVLSSVTAHAELECTSRYWCDFVGDVCDLFCNFFSWVLFL